MPAPVYTAVFEALGDGIVAADAFGRIVYVNAALEYLLGWTRNQLIDRPLTTLMPERMHEAFDAGFRRYQAGQTPRILKIPTRVPALRSDGREVDVEVTLSRFSPNGSEWIVAAFRDVSSPVEIERQLAVSRQLRTAAALAGRITGEPDPSRAIAATVDALLADFGAIAAHVWPVTPAGTVDLAAAPQVAEAARTRSNQTSPASAALPLLAGGDLLGVLGISFASPVESEVLEVLSSVAAILASSLLGARLIAERDAERQRLDLLFRSVPAAVSIKRGERLAFEYANDRYLELGDRRDIAGRAFEEVFPELVQQGFKERELTVLHTGISWTASQVPVDLRLEDGSHRHLFVNLTVQPIRDAAGEVTGVMTVATDVTEVAVARQNLSLILESIGESITVLSDSGRLLYANQAAVRLAGMASAEEMTQIPMAELAQRYELRDQAGRPVPIDTRLPGIAALRAGRPTERVLKVRNRATGQELYVVVTSTPLKTPSGPSVITVMRDVTERKRDEDSWRFLAEASAVLGWSLDTESTLRAVARLAVPQIADWCVVELADHPPASTPELHARALRARTEEIWVDARMPGIRSLLVAPIQIQDQVHGAFLFATSEAGRRYDEQDLILAREIGRRAALAVENSRLFREARDAIRTRDEFLSVAAHELRTPLTTLRLHAETIQRHARLGREPMSDKLVDKVGRIVRQTYRLQELINSLLDVARISQGRLELTREADLDLAELAREIAGRFAEQLEEAGCVLTLDVEPARGNWDRLRLDGVITNLLTNAMKYGKGKPIEMTVRAGVSSAKLSVADHGIGIAPEDQQRIFGRFERAVSGHHYGGMGLGLWITGQIVEAHGGAITVQSSAGAGARFTVELPL